MIEPEPDEVLEHVGHDRRKFIKRVVIGAAFAVPVVSSFSMSGANTAAGVPITGGGNIPL